MLLAFLCLTVDGICIMLSIYNTLFWAYHMHYHVKLKGQPDAAWGTAKKLYLPSEFLTWLCVWRWFFTFLGTEWIWFTVPIWLYFIGPDSYSFSHPLFSSCLSDTIFLFFAFFLPCTFYTVLPASIEGLPNKKKNWTGKKLSWTSFLCGW